MTLSVVLLTYGRLEYAQRTLTSAVRFLSSNEHVVRWHIASDGDTPEYIESLVDTLVAYGIPSEVITLSNSYRGGYGKNYNLAMQTAHQVSDWVLPLEDDWELLRPFNPDALIRDMTLLGIGCARLGYIGYTQTLTGTLAKGDTGHWLVFDPDCAEPHVFAGHPRIELVAWSRTVGPWPEGKNPGETEFEVSHRIEARTNVGWPLEVVKPSGDLFAHIGTVRSY